MKGAIFRRPLLSILFINKLFTIMSKTLNLEGQAPSVQASPVQEIAVVNFLGEDIRVLGTPQDPLFIASDVARWIDNADASSMCRMLEASDTEKVLISSKSSNGTVQNREVLAVTEQGLYKILWRSNKPKAQQFASKCADIIKEIRLTGSYSVAQPSYQLPQNYVEALEALITSEKEKLLLQDKNNEQKHIIRQQSDTIDVLLPKAIAFDDETSTGGWYSGSEAAKLIYGRAFKDGRTKLYEFLREKGILLRVGKNNMPSGHYMDIGWLKTVWTSDERTGHEVPTPVFSKKGIKGIHRMLVEEEMETYKEPLFVGSI